jgi:hypothetical protein
MKICYEVKTLCENVVLNNEQDKCCCLLEKNCRFF